MTYKVTVEGTNLRFGAAHFITMGGKCERLHGHNYGVFLEIEGPLSADSYVFDFIRLKQILRDACEVLDHRFLLPLHNAHFTVSHEQGHWEILFDERRYVFPERDVLPLPLDNITAERLAEHIWSEVARALAPDNSRALLMTVGVEEAPGQIAWYTHPLAGDHEAA